MIEKLQKENMSLKDEMTAQNNQLVKNKTTTSQKSLVSVSDEIKMIKERLEEER